MPTERLLVYEVKESWEPLCKFLGVDVPDKPFPHLNDTSTFCKTIRRRLTLAVAAPTTIALLVVLVLLRFCRRSRR